MGQSAVFSSVKHGNTRDHTREHNSGNDITVRDLNAGQWHGIYFIGNDRNRSGVTSAVLINFNFRFCSLFRKRGLIGCLFLCFNTRGHKRNWDTTGAVYTGTMDNVNAKSTPTLSQRQRQLCPNVNADEAPARLVSGIPAKRQRNPAGAKRTQTLVTRYEGPLSSRKRDWAFSALTRLSGIDHSVF